MIGLLTRRRLRAAPIMLPVAILAAASTFWWGGLGLLMSLPLLGGVLRFSAERATVFEAGLPIRARDLFLSRVLFSLLCVQLPMLAWIVVSLVQGRHAWPMHLMIDASLIAALVVILPYSVRPSEMRPPAWAALLPLLALGVIAAAAIYFLPPEVATILLAVGIVGVSAGTFVAIPESFQVAPRFMAGKAGAVRAIGPGLWPVRAASANSETNAGWYWPVLRSVVNRGMLLSFAFMALFGALHGPWLVYVTIFAFSGSGSSRTHTRWMHALPLSRRAMLLVLVVPTAVTLLGGVAVGHLIPLPFYTESMSRGAPRLHTPHYYDNRTNVPLEFWQREPSPRVGPIVAPWGETAEPDTLALPGMTVFNPFTSHEANSQRFIEWQFERATAAVYGHRMTIADYDAGDARHRTRVTSSPRMWILNGGATLVLFVILMWLCERTYSYRAAMRPHRVLDITIPLIPMVATVADYALGVDRGTGIIIPAAEALLLQLSRTLPQYPLVIVVVAAAPVIVAFKLLEWQFTRTEFAERAMTASR